MRDAVDEIRGRGGELSVVGNGSPRQAAAFQDEYALPFALYVDPEMKAYRAAGLRRGVGLSFGFRSFINAARAWRGGFRQSRTQGDPWQQGGAFVIAPGGLVLYRQVSQVAGDHADPADLIAAVASSGSFAAHTA